MQAKFIIFFSALCTCLAFTEALPVNGERSVKKKSSKFGVHFHNRMMVKEKWDQTKLIVVEVVCN
jgi:hypothetical protein